ncbi:hypothetical protein J3R74_002084 [Puniceicoccus vermicola]
MRPLVWRKTRRKSEALPPVEMMVSPEIQPHQFLPCSQGRGTAVKRWRGVPQARSFSGADRSANLFETGETSPPAEAGPPPPTSRRGVEWSRFSSSKTPPLLAGEGDRCQAVEGCAAGTRIFRFVSIGQSFRNGGTSPPADAGPPLLREGGESDSPDLPLVRLLPCLQGRGTAARWWRGVPQARSFSGADRSANLFETGETSPPADAGPPLLRVGGESDTPESASPKFLPCLQRRGTAARRWRGVPQARAFSGPDRSANLFETGETSPRAEAGPPLLRVGGESDTPESASPKFLPCLQGRGTAARRWRGVPQARVFSGADRSSNLFETGKTSPPADAGPPLLRVGGESDTPESPSPQFLPCLQGRGTAVRRWRGAPQARAFSGPDRSSNLFETGETSPTADATPSLLRVGKEFRDISFSLVRNGLERNGESHFDIPQTSHPNPRNLR